MAKNNTSTVSIESQLAALELQRTNLLALKQEKEQEKIDAIAAEIDKLPGRFGVEGLPSVMSLIKQRITGTLGRLAGDAGTRKDRVVVTPENKVAALVRILHVKGAGNQRSEVAESFGVTYGTIQNWLSDAELVKQANAKFAADNAPKSEVIAPIVNAVAA